MDVSLLGGWLPWTLRALTVVLVAAVIGRRRLRDRRFLVRRLPAVLGGAALFGVLCAVLVRTVFAITDPLPFGLWFWLAVAALAACLGAVCWRGSRWWQRTAAPCALVMALLTAGDALDIGLGYYPTLADMYGELTDQALPQQISMDQLGGIHGNTTTGRIVAVTIPATPSGFQHRTEYVYLPPAWFRSVHRPKLPVVEMIGGEYAVPDNWVRAGNAVKTADAYAATHHGFAPVLVFADASGGFKVDTECVDGTAGKAADHLVKDIPAFVEKNFGTSTAPAKWAIAGWSMGGTCAVTLAVTHPGVFNHFLDISGDLGPNMGDKDSTISKLYGGDAAAYAANDPMTVLGKHKKFPKGFSGMFADGDTEDKHIQQAHQLAAAAKKDGVTSEVYVASGKHSWTFAQAAFQEELPWLAKALQVPGAK
ncbi:alpha/beta hydrolase [Catenulispora subtropica]|uniref:Alpha/beta hydrolase-fold protein n=1 Tax=Catenulispora subtropica TaxID=450798 RepID=A0ABN2TEP1_9ACTN